jgi:hypothetical protein
VEHRNLLRGKLCRGGRTYCPTNSRPFRQASYRRFGQNTPKLK